MIIASLMIALNLAAVDDDCITVSTTVNGSSMEGLLWQDQPLDVRSLGCGMPERYDYVVFRLKGENDPIIKQLWGQPGDTIEVMDNGRLKVNAVEVTTPFGRPYVLLGSARTRLKKITNPIDGFLLLGHPGSVDSAKVGLVAKEDILGFVPAQALSAPKK